MQKNENQEELRCNWPWSTSLTNSLESSRSMCTQQTYDSSKFTFWNCEHFRLQNQIQYYSQHRFDGLLPLPLDLNLHGQFMSKATTDQRRQGVTWRLRLDSKIERCRCRCRCRW